MVTETIAMRRQYDANERNTGSKWTSSEPTRMMESDGLDPGAINTTASMNAATEKTTGR